MSTLVKIALLAALTALAIWFGYMSAKAFGDPARPTEPNVPFIFDANVCDGEIVAWCYNEPNVPLYYFCRFFTKSGRPANPLQVQVDHSNMPVPLTLLYHGMTRIDSNDPNGPGWYHEWTVGYVPMYEGVHALNITATYGPRNSDKKTFRQQAGPKESDIRTVLVDCVQGDSPFLLNGEDKGEIAMKKKQTVFQYAMKRKSLYFGTTTPAIP